MNKSRSMPQIETIVLLMLENRSLDNVLGWLYSRSDGKGGVIIEQPERVVPDGSSAHFDGLLLNMSNSYKGKPLPVEKGLARAPQPCRVPRLDPHEDFPNVKEQMFADGYGKLPSSFGGTPKMKGFAWNFDALYESWQELDEVMGAYDAAQLPILNGLARNYAVSDAWFSSVPSQTNPNRAFSLCGTSLGRTSNLHETAVEQFDTRTIWNAFPESVSWGLYYHSTWHDSKCFTQYTFPQIEKSLGNGEIAPWDSFLKKASLGHLPDFTFLEPKWGYGKGTRESFIGEQGNDYHPPTWVGPGEVFVNEVYNCLTSNRDAWNKTLLIVTFDEHGGTYDHVAPPLGAVRPDDCGNDEGFSFDRFGVRVPTILISPYIPKSTVFRAGGNTPYDHTSLIATILRWKGVDPTSAGLGKRVAAAPTFDNVLSSHLRDDVPRFTDPAGYAEQGLGIKGFAEASGLSVAEAKQIVHLGGTEVEIRKRMRQHQRKVKTQRTIVRE